MALAKEEEFTALHEYYTRRSSTRLPFSKPVPTVPTTPTPPASGFRRLSFAEQQERRTKGNIADDAIADYSQPV
ncbi:hypothetical protein FRX31_012175 [Thalictrum thalictroides]|uniref:Uncharacterized protein n=1 Tax=Thalictrum thalictroides TaxID=46969 RepID=A0A7J6WMQ1_THATH|nr:hypothetical protein FRX31_012175 [Thalictrum thalictroides]